MSSDPKTLLQLAGVSLTPAPLDNAVLVIIDAQQEYTVGRLVLNGVEEAIVEAARLLALARAHRVPVIHVVQHGRPGGALFDPSTSLADIVPELAPTDGEAVVVKSLPNAFAGTGLHDRLQAIRRESGRRELLLAGFMTHMCISATARAALDLGIRTTVVAAATATRDLPDPLGGVVQAELVHRAALAELADRFATVVPDIGCLHGATARVAPD